MIIQEDRLLGNMMALGHIGFEENSGTSRMAYSEAFLRGRDYVREVMENAGLETHIDPVGNLTGRLNGEACGIISAGSHIDTVPDGGMYDGTYGVLAAVEAIRTMRESGYVNRHPIEVIAFVEEEGNVVGGTFGSKSFAGQPQEPSTMEKIKNYGMDAKCVAASKRDGENYRCYLEWHIEQGGVLEAERINVGVVEGIVAIARYMVTVPGCANHAGSTPMNLRDDALVKACRMIGRVIDISGETEREMTCTIGCMDIQPGAVNVIPGQVSFPIEFRSMHPESIKQAISRLYDEVKDEGVTVENFLWQGETHMDTGLMDTLENCARGCGCSFKRMPSGAGHDAINMALFTKTAMLFIPSAGGVSHSIKEYSTSRDMAMGAQILLDVMLRLDKEE